MADDNSNQNYGLSGNLPSLDGVRGIAITLVLIHTTNILQVGADPLGRLLSRFAGMGWVGVQLFFVLSGFLITRNLLRMQGQAGYFRVFYGRRVLRIFPLYYATLLFFFVFLPWIGYAPQAVNDEGSHQIWLWLFLSNWTEWLGLGGLSLPHFWSLAVEEQFYLLWPVALHQRTPRQTLYFCAAIAAVSSAFRCGMVLYGVEPLVIYTSSLCRMDALAMGAMAATILSIPKYSNILTKHRGQLILVTIGLGVVGKLIPNGFGMIDPIGQTLGYTLLAVIFSLAITAAVVGEHVPTGIGGDLLKSKALRMLGKYSFAMYLFHAPLNTYVGQVMLDRIGWREHPSTLQSLIYVALVGVSSLILAILSYELLEKHFLRLKQFFAR